MASIRNLNGRWQARVVRKGHAPEAKPFTTRDAERWARSVEAAMDRGSYESREEADKTTLGDLVRRYVAEGVPGTRGAHDDAIRLNALQCNRICRLRMTSVTPTQVAAFRDKRLRTVKPATDGRGGRRRAW